MKIYVGNVSPEVTDAELRELFTPYGEVESAEVVRDRFTSTPRGFGFVVMPVQPEAIAAITALQGQEFKGRALEVNEARPPVDRRGGGPGGGGGGGRGRRPDRNRGHRDDRRGGGRRF
jgi:RNA recognition motif-containing protein